jgi:hypothetical protein
VVPAQDSKILRVPHGVLTEDCGNGGEVAATERAVAGADEAIVLDT